MNEQPRLKRILAATDMGDCATGALEHAKTFARRFEAEITMVHAVPMLASVEPFPITPIYLGQDFVAEQHAAATALDDYRTTHLRGDNTTAPVLEAGDPATAILATSQSRDADLVVMGTHGRRGIKRALLGSVAERVIAESEIPVLTVRCDAPRHARIERILCPVNYSGLAAKALRYATLLASAFDAELIVLNLLEDDHTNDLDRELDRLRAWVGDVSIPARARVLVHRGEAASQVNEYARRNGVDLIVVGAQRKGSKGALGSTTHRLTRQAPCPVLTVPPSPFDQDLRAA